jgi:hypothetical protein
VIDGHQVISPPQLLASAKSAADGSYRIAGIPFGNYHIKASASGYQAEFFNGQLFNEPYAFGAGIVSNRGVFNVLDIKSNGRVTLLQSGPASNTNVHFELELGA